MNTEQDEIRNMHNTAGELTFYTYGHNLGNMTSDWRQREIIFDKDNQFSKEQAIRIGQSEVWEYWNNKQILRFQLFQEKLAVPGDRFHKAVEMFLRRPILQGELTVLYDTIVGKYLESHTMPLLKELMEMIPVEKRNHIISADPYSHTTKAEDTSKYQLIIDDYNIQRFDYCKLYRIEALKDFSDVTKGDLGGFVEHEHNLSHQSNCWIYDDAQVFDHATVSDNAAVCNNAVIYGYARVHGAAQIAGNTEWCGDNKDVG